ncbi:MAG TPA: hemolysin family protein [Bdellovibrionota bacterium]|jgi:putative hemolysin|nr:hemolysin family protein [Bdellovibrionota bacterium]
MFVILTILACLLLNACIAAYEMAFVSVRKSELKKLARNHNLRAQKILQYRENPERTLSVLQIGINLVGALSAAVGGAGAEESVAPALEKWFNLSAGGADLAALLLVVLPLTYLTVVIGELVPKSLALRYATKISVGGLPFLTVFERILNPVVALLATSTKWILRVISGGKATAIENPIETSLDLESVSSQGRQYVINLVNIESKKIRDLMLPWDEVYFVNEDDSIPKVTDMVLSSGHTRLPVVSATHGVIGIIHTKEFIALVHSGEDRSWSQLLRSALKASEGDFALPLLRTMQDKKSHMAIVYNTEKVAVGIITLEDILEEVVGDIADEDDESRFRKIFASEARNRNRTF